MNNYYFLSWKQKPEGTMAFTSDETILGYELIPELKGISILPFDLHLKKVKEKKSGLKISDDLTELEEIWNDYQPNNLAWPLMSEKLKKIIDENVMSNENIDWISCKIKNGTETRNYYILRFNKLLDVLDLHKTKFVPGTDSIIKPVFASSKVRKFNVFMAATPGEGDFWKISSGVYVSESIKKSIQNAGLVGIELSEVPTS